jgi:hypothetical protein
MLSVTAINFDIFDQPCAPAGGEIDTARSGCHICFFCSRNYSLCISGHDCTPPKLGRRRAPREVQFGVVCLHPALALFATQIGTDNGSSAETELLFDWDVSPYCILAL